VSKQNCSFQIIFYFMRAQWFVKFKDNLLLFIKIFIENLPNAKFQNILGVILLPWINFPDFFIRKRLISKFNLALSHHLPLSDFIPLMFYLIRIDPCILHCLNSTSFISFLNIKSNFICVNRNNYFMLSPLPIIDWINLYTIQALLDLYREIRKWT